jgi:serine/threonine protein kinase
MKNAPDVGTIRRMPLVTGQSFAGYTIIRLLGSGGMGEVYLAQHPRLPRRDALKLLPQDWSADADYRARFNREADLASTLWHPHIVGVHDRGEENDQLWISMDFVDGLDGARLLSDRHPAGMPLDEVARIVTAVASALDYAHKQGLLHRDVKPANIMLTHLDDDGEQRILLTDFGIARNVDDISGLTATNMTVGTAAYCAPEQLLGEDVNGRTDQYSLAATAYHLLTGSQLFPSTNQVAVIGRQLTEQPPALADTRPEIAAFDDVFRIALAKKPPDRFPRCADFASAFASAGAAPLRGGKKSRKGPPTSTAVRAAATDTISANVGAVRPTATPPRTTKAGSRASIEKYAQMDRMATSEDLADLIANEAKGSAETPSRSKPDASTEKPTGAKKASATVSKSPAAQGQRSTTSAGVEAVTQGERWLKVLVHNGTLKYMLALAVAILLVLLVARGLQSAFGPSGDGGQPVHNTTSVSSAAPAPTTSSATSVRPPPESSPPSAMGFPVSAIDGVLPTPTEVSRVVGAVNLQIKSTQGMSDNSGLVTPFTCVGVIFGADRKVYANSGFDAIIDQRLQPANYAYTTTGPIEVEQTVAVFPAAQQAQTVLTSSQRQWQSCAAGQVHYGVPGTNGEVGWGFNLGSVQFHDDILTVSMAGINRESGDSACQQALGIRANVVVGARTCLEPDIPTTATAGDPNLAGQYAQALAADILSHIHF